MYYLFGNQLLGNQGEGGGQLKPKDAGTYMACSISVIGSLRTTQSLFILKDFISLTQKRKGEGKIPYRTK